MNGAVSGTLFVVATPIGNLEDITFRAVRVLKDVKVIACEDTRVSRKLLDRYDIETPMVSCHAHSSSADIQRLLDRLVDGDDVALISDAGTPLLSDPGSPLVEGAIALGVVVTPLPGPSALLAAIAGAGLPTARLLFLGFLPRGDGDRREVLAPIRNLSCTVVLYEAPGRVAGTLEVLERTLGNRPACVARELTKKFETFERGTLGALRERLAEGVRGEVVIVVGPPDEGNRAVALDDVREEARRLIARGEGASEIARTLAGAFGLTKKQTYKIVLALKNGER